MSRTSLILIISLSSLILLANAATRPLHIVRHDPMVDPKAELLKFCKITTNPNLCAQTLEPHYTGIKGALEPLRALEIAVEATNNQTKKTLAIIDELLAKKDASKDLKDSLSVCKDQYSSILDSIKETKDSIAKKDVLTAKYMFSAVLSYQATCKDQFEGLDFPFANDSDAVFQLGGNCLDIIADIQKAIPQKLAPIVNSPPSAFSKIIGTIS